MKLPVLLIVALLTMLSTSGVEAAGKHHAGRWRNLGELHVQDRVDRDILRVGIQKGTFDAIRLEVKGRAVQFHDLKIHFKNGEVQDVRLRSVIDRGQSSRVIDLEGGQRAIEKIVFLYDAQTLRRHKGARVKVFGRR